MPERAKMVWGKGGNEKNSWGAAAPYFPRLCSTFLFLKIFN